MPSIIKNLEVPENIVDVVLDTDAYNEIDDQFAIAYMLQSEEKLKVKALFAAPFHNQKSSGPRDGMERSYDEIIKILTLAGRKDLIPDVYKGSECYLKSENEAVESDAAHALCKLADGYTSDSPLYVVAIGAITNIASAILLKPEIAERIVVVWLGGNSIDSPNNAEFNSSQDIAAARVITGCGVPFVQLPCHGVVDRFYTTAPELEYWLADKNPLADYLARNTISEAESYAAGRPWSRVIWDVTAVAWLLNDGERFMDSKIISAPIPEYDNHLAFDPGRKMMRYVSYIKRDELMEDLFRKLLK